MKNIVYLALLVPFIMLVYACGVGKASKQNNGFLNYYYFFVDEDTVKHYASAENYIPKKGYVSSASTAVKIAEAVWLSPYTANIRKEKPYSISLVKDSIWMVTDSFPMRTNGPIVVGGPAYIEIQKKDGKILKVILGKIETERGRISDESYIPKDGYVSYPDAAAKIAEAVWLSIYGKKIYKQGPYAVSLVKDSIWTVMSGLPIRRKGVLVGGIDYIEIQKKDGQILKVTHMKKAVPE